MKNIFLLPIAVLISAQLYAQETPPVVTIPSTQKLSLKSKIIDQEYDLLVHLPGNYNTQKDKTYPVLYLLDAQWDFPLVTGLYGSQYYDGFIPDGLIIVGITWGGKDPNPSQLRFRDFTPMVQNGPAGTGNAEKFLSVIRNEFIPFIESKFRAKKNDRVLVGSSLGGLFTLYALISDHSLFNRYILTSPALQYGNGIIHEYEKVYAGKKLPLKAKLYMAHGDLEYPETFEQFVQRLNGRNYEGLELQTRILDHTGHSGTKAEGYARGLQWVFGRPSLDLAPELLNNYAGSYELGNNNSVRFVAEGNKLVAILPNNNRLILEAATETDFYLKGQFLNVHFKKDQAGKISGFDFEQFEGTRFVKKISK
jgi:predicted alpha/beta superfamily hydrolase